VVTTRLTLLLLAAAALAGCDEHASASPPPDAAPPEAPRIPSSTPTATAAPSGSAAAEKAPLQVLKLVFTSEVKNREPVDKLDAIKPGERAWAHLTMRNRGAEARPIAMVFKVNGEQRSKVDLKIEPSWSYRTWAYSTLRAADVSGELVVEVQGDDGAVITTARLPIKGDGKGDGKSGAPAKPRPPKQAPDDL
jgi:hypothetical protein